LSFGLLERRDRDAEPDVSATQLLLVGVGGQGVLTAAQVLASAAHASGHTALVGQLHGMSQRGGSVECTLRLGDVHTSQIIGDSVDVVLGFELLETERALPSIGPKTIVVTHTGRIVPSSVTIGGAPYPESAQILDELRARARRLVTLDAADLARRAGASRSLNAVLLGALAGLDAVPIPVESIQSALAARCAPAFLTPNRRAFELGVGAIEDDDGQLGNGSLDGAPRYPSR
jgi:indolepyruvate ferredoxin oxidoreductase beta subunit